MMNSSFQIVKVLFENEQCIAIVQQNVTKTWKFQPVLFRWRVNKLATEKTQVRHCDFSIKRNNSNIG